MSVIGPRTLNPCGSSGGTASPSNDTPGRNSTRAATKGRAGDTSAEVARAENPKQPAPLAPIPGCDGYFVQRDDASPLRGRVLSAPKRRMFGTAWKQLKADVRGRVKLPVNGVYQWRSVRGLVRRAFEAGGAV